jgi:hypothetical protein
MPATESVGDMAHTIQSLPRLTAGDMIVTAEPLSDPPADAVPLLNDLPQSILLTSGLHHRVPTNYRLRTVNFGHYI